MPPDPRIPVTILTEAALPAWLGAGGPAALVTDAAPPPAGFVAAEPVESRPVHRFGCACCAGRPAVAIALDRLFQARVRGRTPWFDRVAILVAAPAIRQDLAAALAGDALTLARYRPG